MSKFLKYTGIILGVLILLSIIFLTCLVLFVNPNRFKPLIAEQVQKYSGHELVIDGDLAWQIFPVLGVKVGHLELHNPANFKQKVFAEIDSAMVSIHAKPLLQGRIQSSGITLKGLKLNLIKNAEGKTNWQTLSASDPGTNEATESHGPLPISQENRHMFSLAISAIDVSNATITWTNEQANQAFHADHMDLHAKDINLTKPFPLKTTFNFASSASALMGKVDLESKIALSLEKQLFVFDDVNFNAKLDNKVNKIDIGLKGNFIVDLFHEKLQLDNLLGQIANVSLEGKVDVVNLLSKPHTTGHLQMKPFDVKELLKNLGQNVAELKVVKDLSGGIDFSVDSSFQSLNLTGNLKLDELQTTKVLVTDINVTPQLQKGVLTLAPFTGKFYQGTLDGNATINLNDPIPLIALNTKLSNVQAEPLLNDLTRLGKFKISGLGNIDLKVTTSGTSSDLIIKNLNGTAQFAFNNGVLHGIDMDYLINSALTMVNKQTLSSPNTDQTPFGTLTASAVIHDGIMVNKDFYLNSPRFEVKGDGNINLNTQQLNYHLQTTIKKDDPSRRDNFANLYGYAAPVNVTGSLNNPVIRLDMDGLMKAVAQQQLEKAKIRVQEKIQDKITNQLPDEIKNKIPEQAGKLLNNLLGH